MKTDDAIFDLIGQLSSDLKPVRVQASPVLFSAWLGTVCFFVSLIGVFVLSPRSDILASVLNNRFFMGDVIFSLGLLFSSLMLSGWLSSPGRPGGRIYFIACLIFGVLVFASLFVRIFGLTAEQSKAGLDLVTGENCLFATFAFAFVASMIIGIAVRKRASVRPALTGIAVGCAGLGAGGLAITLHCGSDNGLHIALWHFLLPGVLSALVGYSLGKKILRW